jgi:hypothetical protein
MAFSLPLPTPLPAQGWKVKIRDRERNEPPHVTILHKTRAWRFDLRGGGFMDGEPDPRDVPAALLAVVALGMPLLQERWDAMYPENPVSTRPLDDDE